MNIVICGAGNIGFETLKLVSPGNNVAVIDKWPGSYLQEFAHSRSDVTIIQADATSLPEMEEVVLRRLPDAWHTIDCLICTVGTKSNQSFFDDFSVFQEDFRLNFFSNLSPIKAFGKTFMEQRCGKIVVISSTSGHHGPDNLLAYGPAKWALESLCGALRSEMRPFGVSVDVISPVKLQNRYSGVFKFNSGIDPRRVAITIHQRLGSNRGKNYFVPRYQYLLVHVMERILPWLLDIRAGLGWGRRKCYRHYNVESVLITGASSGLGAALARIYAAKVKTLYLVSRSVDALEKLKQEIEKCSRCNVNVYGLDMGDRDAVSRYIRELPDVDMIINNAGQHCEATIEDTDVETYQKLFDVNFLGAVHLIKEFCSREKQPKKIINILSTAAIAGRKGMSAYCGSKSALWSLTRSFRRLHGSKIQVLEVMPATFTSTLLEKSLPGAVRNGRPSPQNILINLTNAEDIARRVVKAEMTGKETLFLPFASRIFLLLESACPPLFRRLFP